MSAVDAVGAAVVLRAPLMAFLAPELDTTEVDPRIFPIESIMSCASLHHTIHREEALRLPARRRLVLDLVGLKEMLQE